MPSRGQSVRYVFTTLQQFYNILASVRFICGVIGYKITLSISGSPLIGHYDLSFIQKVNAV